MTHPVELKISYEEYKSVNVKNEEEENFKNEVFICNICQKKFFKKASLMLHINSHSANNCIREDDKHNVGRGGLNTCNICCKKFSAKKNLLKHLRDVHKNYEEAAQMVVKKLKCPERDCKFVCRMMKDLRNHIENYHKIKILKDTLQFSSETAFQKWKKEEETNTVSWFVTGRKKTTLTDGTKKQTLGCHRTGHYNPKGFGKYRMRAVGSCKIGVTCPAAMEVTELPDGQTTVIYYKTHLGHMQDVVYLKLSKEERAHLAGKIEQGFSFDAILEDVKDKSSFKDNTKRIHLLSKKDLYSIMRTANNNSSGKKMKKEVGEMNDIVIQPKDIDNSKEALLSRNYDCGKLESIQQNFSLHTAKGVIIPQEYNAVGNPNFVQCQKLVRDSSIPQVSGEGITSQIVILSPDNEYSSVAEIILLSAGEATSQSTVTPQTKIPQLDNSGIHSADQTPQQMQELKLEERNRINKLNLQMKLKEKIHKIVDLLPKTELLTPRQFDTINSKLDGILNIFNVASIRAKARRQGFKKKIVKNGKPETAWRRVEEINKPNENKLEGRMEQQIYKNSLVCAVYN